MTVTFLPEQNRNPMQLILCPWHALHEVTGVILGFYNLCENTTEDFLDYFALNFF